MPSSLSFGFLLLILSFSFSFSSTISFHNDEQSLVAFKNLIASDPHHSMANWNSANPFCNWTGVACSRRHPNRVASLNLTDMDLRGSISPSLGNLSFLRSLDLRGNALHGPIPPQLGDLFRLRELHLNHNELEGSIPPQLGDLFRLRELHLGHNELEGNIPPHLGRCRNLTYLALSFNNLTGSIPRELGSLPYLQQLALGSNDLTEYGLGGTVSTKGDIYSYGILLLEILTRKRPTSDMFSGDLNLHKWVNLSFPNRVKEIIDQSLFSEMDEDGFEENSVYKCLLSLLRVGLLCSKDLPNDRPTMRDVVMVLESLREDLKTNAISPRRLRRSMSHLLSNINATKNNAHASNAQSSSTFSL